MHSHSNQHADGMDTYGFKAALATGKENAADQANFKTLDLATDSAGKQPNTAVDEFPATYTAHLDGAADEDAELLALL